jgi:hypothetical protein
MSVVHGMEQGTSTQDVPPSVTPSHLHDPVVTTGLNEDEGP